MSQDSVIKVIQKALVEPEFRDNLFANPSTALEGFDLTEQESQALVSVKKEAFDAFATEVEQRISKSGLTLGSIGNEPAIFQDNSFFNSFMTAGPLVGRLR